MRWYQSTLPTLDSIEVQVHCRQIQVEADVDREPCCGLARNAHGDREIGRLPEDVVVGPDLRREGVGEGNGALEGQGRELNGAFTELKVRASEQWH